MKLHKTTDPNPSSETELLHIYNALDCCITLEVLNALISQLDEVSSKTYEFSLALQAPILEMECRGVLVDREAIVRERSNLEAKILQLEEQLKEILELGIGVTINWNSPVQLMNLFYSVLGLPINRNKGKPTVDEKAMTKLRGYFYAEPIVNHIMAIRQLKKNIGVLKTGIDPDNRIRTSYNIAGTDTGRLSSYKSAFGSGTNLQNITGDLRGIFISDPGYKFAYIDLQQVQSRIVGAICWNIFHDGTYLDACESQDLHTLVCKFVWQDKDWSGDLLKDKKLAKGIFIPGTSYRDAAKALGHGTNFYGKPQHMAQETRIPVALVTAFREKYLQVFPCINERFTWTRNKLIKDGFITTMAGRRRWFFGRRWEEETFRAALAYEPQDVEAKILNSGMLGLWREAPEIHLALQMHDALLIQYPEEQENELVTKAMKLMEVEIPLLYNRTLLVPTEAFVGWNWQYASQINTDGLVEFNGNDTRRRTVATKVDLMDRLLR